MKRTISKLLGIAALAITGIAGSFMLATPAQAVTTTITCTSYLPNTNNYPRDQAGHAQLCSRTVVNGSNTTVTTPTTSRANILFGAVSGAYAVNHSLPAVVKNRLIADNVKYFFFNNRDDADLYFNGVAPYNQIAIPVHSFKGGPGHARCGNTGYGYLGIGKVIAVAVYDTCNYDNLGTTGTNPALEKTVLHETGHAYDFSFASFAFQQDFPSSRQGFDRLAADDITVLTPANWSSRTVAQKDAIVCNLFNPNSGKPSQIEQDLGAVLLPPNNPLGKVCNVGSPNGTRLSYWVTPTEQDPTYIVKNRLPYFTTQLGARQELWAELFVTENYGSYGTTNFLSFTDSVLVNTSGTPRAFNCTRQVLNSYVFTGSAPASVPGCVVNGAL